MRDKNKKQKDNSYSITTIQIIFYTKTQ